MSEEVKDINAKIGTPEEALWDTIKRNTEERIRQSEAALEIDKQVLKYVVTKIETFK